MAAEYTSSRILGLLFWDTTSVVDVAGAGGAAESVVDAIGVT